MTLDEADHAIVEALNNAPRSLQPDQLELLTRGSVFLAYFPNTEESGAAPSATGATALPPPPPSTSVTKLFLFFEPSYQPTVEEALELGVAPGAPVPLLCWCEPNVPRYVKTDQAISLDQVSALHLGASSSAADASSGVEVFPRQAVRSSCFSVVTQHVALHLEADSSAMRKAWFIAIYTLVAQAPAQAPAQQPQAPAQTIPAASQQAVPQSMQSYQPQTSPPTATSSSTSSSSSSRAASSTSLSTLELEEDRLEGARRLLEGGMPFVVYVLDKSDIDLTTRHEVSIDACTHANKTRTRRRILTRVALASDVALLISRSSFGTSPPCRAAALHTRCVGVVVARPSTSRLRARCPSTRLCRFAWYAKRHTSTHHLTPHVLSRRRSAHRVSLCLFLFASGQANESIQGRTHRSAREQQQQQPTQL